MKNGLHDFGTDIHYDVISFVSNLLEVSYWEAAKKIMVDFQLDISKIKSMPIIKRERPIIAVPKITIKKGRVPQKIKCYFDQKTFSDKPLDIELAKIKNRIKNGRLDDYFSVNEIADEIINGKTCIPSGIRGGVDKNWKKQQLWMLDFDNKIDGEDVYVDDCRHMTVQQILDYCQNQNFLPTIIYNTFSNSEQQHKFRLVYIFDKPIKDIAVAKQISVKLLDMFKEFNPDKSKRSLADMFLGGSHIAYMEENFYKIEKERE